MTKKNRIFYYVLFALSMACAFVECAIILLEAYGFGSGGFGAGHLTLEFYAAHPYANAFVFAPRHAILELLDVLAAGRIAVIAGVFTDLDKICKELEKYLESS